MGSTQISLLFSEIIFKRLQENSILIDLPSKNESVLDEIVDVLKTPQDPQFFKKNQISSCNMRYKH